MDTITVRLPGFVGAKMTVDELNRYHEEWDVTTLRKALREASIVVETLQNTGCTDEQRMGDALRLMYDLDDQAKAWTNNWLTRNGFHYGV